MDCPEGSDLAEETPVSAEGEPAQLSLESGDPGGTPPETEHWRKEVANRVERYRTRRKTSAPKYPSLHLPFDAIEDAPVTAAPGSGLEASVADFVPGSHDALARDSIIPQAEEKPRYGPIPHEWRRPLDQEAAPSTNVIEFPRSAVVPGTQSELAEPVVDRPRIVEAPEVVPPPPALGGILIEGPTETEPGQHLTHDIQSESASRWRRVLAALIDGAILLVAIAGFAAIFVRLNPELLHSPHISVPLIAGGFFAVAMMLWAAYGFLFMVYVGTTPGLRVARLRLVTSAGSPPGRRLRRWRVLASYLSALSLGLGYAWNLLDEDGLCWHDRITRTHMEMAPPNY